MPHLDLIIRLIAVVSMLLSSFPSASAFASPPRRPVYQTEEPPTVTPTPVPSVEATATETTVITSTETATPVETVELSPTETLTPTETATVTPIQTLPPPLIETATPQDTATSTPLPLATQEFKPRDPEGYIFLPFIIKSSSDPLIQAAYSNLVVTNPDFEQGQTGWTEAPSSVAFPATSIWRSNFGTGAGRNNSYGYSISNHAYGNLLSNSISQGITGNASYKLSAFVRGEIDPDSSEGLWVIRAEFYNSGGTNIGYQDAISGGPGSLTPDWGSNPKEGQITTPIGTASLKIR
ncbi:MAG: hypothetical protein BroJett011_78020 [Chloroflexota bacterium]|nr:MAG: hypothetical protein BroJett011_78020 [Chloroflexota bacterium]